MPNDALLASEITQLSRVPSDLIGQVSGSIYSSPPNDLAEIDERLGIYSRFLRVQEKRSLAATPKTVRLKVDENGYFVLSLETLVTGVTNEAIHAESTEQALNQSAPATTIPPALHANWFGLSQSGLSNDAFERLRKLADKSDGWHGPSSKTLSAASLDMFLKFWDAVRDIAVEPELMLTPRGTLQAEWYRSHRQFLDIEFTGVHSVGNFGLIDVRTRLEGTMPIQEILATIKGYRNGIALKWSSLVE